MLIIRTHLESLKISFCGTLQHMAGHVELGTVAGTNKFSVRGFEITAFVGAEHQHCCVGTIGIAVHENWLRKFAGSNFDVILTPECRFCNGNFTRCFYN